MLRIDFEIFEVDAFALRAEEGLSFDGFVRRHLEVVFFLRADFYVYGIAIIERHFDTAVQIIEFLEQVCRLFFLVWFEEAIVRICLILIIRV